MNNNTINAFMRKLKQATLDTGVAIEWTEIGIGLRDVQNELADGRYTWVSPDNEACAWNIIWEYEGETR